MSTAPVIPPPPPRQPFEALPARLYAGDTLSFAVQTQLPPLTGTVAFVLTGVVANVPTGITVPAVTVDADAVATFLCAGAVTVTWGPARYRWVCIGVDPVAATRAVLASGEIRILPDPAAANPVDPRTENEINLASLRAALKASAGDLVQMYKIGTREVTKMSRKDARLEEAILESRVRRERIARGEKVPSRTVGISFGGRG